MTEIRIGTKVKIKENAFCTFTAGYTGKVSKIDRGEVSDSYEVTIDGSGPYKAGVNCVQGSLSRSDLEFLAGDRIVGEPIVADDVRIGDKISTSRGPDQYGVEHPTIGVVAKIVEDPIKFGERNSKDYTHLYLNTQEGGTIYSTWWGTENVITLLEVAPEPHPVEVSEEGDYFEFVNILKITNRFTKFRYELWINEFYSEGQDPSPDNVQIMKEAQVKAIFDSAKKNHPDLEMVKQ